LHDNFVTAHNAGLPPPFTKTGARFAGNPGVTQPSSSAA
jgi:hypothetical protein